MVTKYHPFWSNNRNDIPDRYRTVLVVLLVAEDRYMVAALHGFPRVGDEEGVELRFQSLRGKAFWPLVEIDNGV
jgi:hypothetical protein